MPRLRSRRIRFVLLTQFGAAVFRALTGRVFYNGFDAFTRAAAGLRFHLLTVFDVDREELDRRRRRNSSVLFAVQAGG